LLYFSLSLRSHKMSAWASAKAAPKRFEQPYTLEIETPHAKVTETLGGGPIRLLAVRSAKGAPLSNWLNSSL
jgi:hypothetical protein